LSSASRPSSPPTARRTAPCFARSPSPVFCTHASQGKSPYRGVTPGAYYDAQSKSRPATKIVCGAERRLVVTVRQGRPTASSCLPASPTPTKRLTAPHGPPQPPCAACILPAPPPSPEPKLQRPTPPATAASRLRAPPYPVREHKSSPGEPLVLPHPFPGQTRLRNRPISAGTAASMAKDYIASLSFFPGCFL
jgi:hypothetical protein